MSVYSVFWTPNPTTSYSVYVVFPSSSIRFFRFLTSSRSTSALDCSSMSFSALAW